MVISLTEKSTFFEFLGASCAIYNLRRSEVSNKEIAERFNVSPSVCSRIFSLYTKHIHDLPSQQEFIRLLVNILADVPYMLALTVIRSLKDHTIVTVEELKTTDLSVLLRFISILNRDKRCNKNLEIYAFASICILQDYLLNKLTKGEAISAIQTCWKNLPYCYEIFKESIDRSQRRIFKHSYEDPLAEYMKKDF